MLRTLNSERANMCQAWASK